MAGPEDPTAYDPTYQHAGEECSSTNEGRYVNIVESVLVHPQHDLGLDLVQKGDPCTTYELCGVAMNTATSTSDVVSIDTEGIWWLDVKCFFFGADISVGQRVYIDANAVVSDDVFEIPFGWALGPVTDGQTELIAVKVHSTEWVWWIIFWFMQGPF